MALALYRFLMFCLSPVIWVLLSWRLFKGKEDQEHFNERKGIASIARPAGQLVWCHGASVGEVLSSLSVLSALREQMPAINLLLTTGTRTGYKTLQANAKLLPGTGQTIVQYVPLDFPSTTARFFRHWQPTASVFIESDFWPNLLSAAPHPILLNGRVSDRSWPRYQRYHWFFKPLISRFEHIQAQREEDALRLKAMGGKHVEVGGNIKFDAEPLPADEKQLEKLRAQLGRRPLLVAASTHAGEEELIAQLHLKLRAKADDLLTIIVPRHPHRGTSAANAVLRYIKKGVARRGVGELPILGGPKHTEIYIADTLGELGLWYRLADAAIIGGTLVKTGGHNPLEPLKLGTPTVTGPHMFNFKDMTPLLVSHNLITLAPASAGNNVVSYMAEALLPLLTDANASLKQRAHIGTVMPRLGGASQKAASYLTQTLQKTSKKAV